jgi:hypothetical protein
MKRLIFVFSLALLVGLFALSGGSATHAYAFNHSTVQAQLTSPSTYKTVEHRYYRDDDRYYRSYGYYYPYYYPYPYTYYYGPGLYINTPFFGFGFP